MGTGFGRRPTDADYGLGNVSIDCASLGTFSRYQVLGPQQCFELTGVHLHDQHLAKASQKIAQIRRQWPDVPDVNVRQRKTFLAQIRDPAADRAEGRAPANNRQVARRRALVDFLDGNVIGNAGNLCQARIRHLLVIGRVVGDMPRP